MTVNNACRREFDELWCLIALNLIGEAFPFGLQTGGSVTSSGKFSLFVIWMLDVKTADVATVYSVGVWLRKLVREAGYKDETQVVFYPFSCRYGMGIALDSIPGALMGTDRGL